MGGQSPLQESDLIFPSLSHTLKTTLTSLKRSNLTITNRLASIKSDAAFVQTIAEVYKLPLIANERCGSWYIPPSIPKAGSAYFKSTDGHHGQWAFSLRRLNLQILDILGREGGFILLDSTRRGKSMPDALSKTIPIWLCVLNRLLYPDRLDCHALRTPPDVVSASEHAQIEARIPSFVAEAQGLKLELDAMSAKLGGKALWAEWVTPSTPRPPSSEGGGGEDGEASPAGGWGAWLRVVLLTASSRSSTASSSSSSPSSLSASDYVQGAADDSEAWAHGLSPSTFWTHHALLTSTSEDALPALIEELMAAQSLRSTSEGRCREPVLIAPTSTIYIASNAAAGARYEGDFDLVISASPEPDPLVAEAMRGRYVHLRVPGGGKVGSRQLRAELPKLEVLRSAEGLGILQPDSRVLITCETGRDFAVGVALAVLCRFCAGDGSVSLSSSPESGGTTVDGATALSKTVIKHRLSWIMVSLPDAAPSRATLQSVNAFLLG